MQAPRGFLGTEADLFFDLLVTVVPAVLVVMAVAWRLARRGRWTAHRNVMITLTIVLTLTVGALEGWLAYRGGLENVHPGGVGDAANAILRVHLAFAGTAATVWLGLVGFSLFKFPRPPRPGAFSRTHRLWGRIGMIAMIGTALTAIAFYWMAFVVP